MHVQKTGASLRHYLFAGGSGMALALCLGVGGVAAQDAGEPETEVDEIIVTGYRGSLAAAVLALNTLLIALALLPPALLKLLLPLKPLRRRCDRLMNALASGWVAINNAWIAALQPQAWEVQGVEGLKPRGWSLLSCNHRSWVDILVLQRVFHRPAPRFSCSQPVRGRSFGDDVANRHSRR